MACSSEVQSNEIPGLCFIAEAELSGAAAPVEFPLLWFPPPPAPAAAATCPLNEEDDASWWFPVGFAIQFPNQNFPKTKPTFKFCNYKQNPIPRKLRIDRWFPPIGLFPPRNSKNPDREINWKIKDLGQIYILRERERERESKKPKRLYNIHEYINIYTDIHSWTTMYILFLWDWRELYYEKLKLLKIVEREREKERKCLYGNQIDIDREREREREREGFESLLAFEGIVELYWDFNNIKIPFLSFFFLLSFFLFLD